MARRGSRIIDILLGGAKGYSEGVKSDIPEAGLAMGLGTGFEVGKERGKERKRLSDLFEYERSPEFDGLDEQEKAFFRTNPDAFLGKERTTRVRLRLSQIDPTITPEQDREMEVTPDQYEKILNNVRERNKESKDQEFKERQFNATQNYRQKYLETLRQGKADKAAATAKQRSDALQVPGYKLTGQVAPRVEEAKAARDALGQFETLKQNLGRLDELMQKYGSFEFSGAESAEMENLASDSKIILKELARLGALTGPDLAILNAQIQDPSGVGAFFSKNATARGRVKSVLDTQERKLNARLAALGYARAPNAAPQPQGLGSNAPETNEPLEFASEAEAAAAGLPDGTLVSVGGQLFEWREE